MSVPSKLLDSRAFYAFLAGSAAAQRDEWMREARKERELGRPHIVKQCVAFARIRNRSNIAMLKMIPVPNEAVHI